MSEQTDTFVREVQEEMRRERLAQLWDRYGVFAIALAALLLVGVGGYKYAEYSSLKARETAGQQFEAATRLVAAGKAQEAQEAFDALAKTAPTGYGTLSRLRTAAALAAENKPAEAVAAYDAVAKDASADSLLRDFAAIQAALLRVDTADWTEMQNRLKDLINDGNAWRASARELLGLAAMKAGREDEARKAFEQILGDSAATPATAQRAQVMMTILTEAALAKAASTKAPTTPPGDAAKPDASPAAAPEKK
jgi:hypothetical protein